MNFIENETTQKLRGGYYTPPDLAEFMVRWVRDISPKAILEPSCGDGAFFSALKVVRGFSRASIVGIELDKQEAVKAARRAKECGLFSASVENDDFLSWSLNKLEMGEVAFDAVIGNPPFVRYQYLPSSFQETAQQIFHIFDLAFTKHTNAWVPFVLASLALLRPGGRLAMVVPAEIIHVTHAHSLRAYLGKECRRLVIIDPEELWFADTLQGAVILLAEKRRTKADKSEGLGMYPVKGREFLKLPPSAVFDQPHAINGKTVEGKWTRALLDGSTRALLDELEEHDEVFRFNEVAKVDVGIVTGANKFFLVNDEVVKQYNLSKWAHPMFGRSEHCPGVIYDERQHRANAVSGKPTNFLWFNGATAQKDVAVQAYVKRGEKEELHKRYKCRMRSPWYTVPSVYSTEIGMLKRSHDTPRLILNQIGAYTTDTAYRIRSKVHPKKLVSNFVNPLTALSAELEGRHYGGGVLELIPSEIERLLLPLPAKAEINLSALDDAVRTQSAVQVLERQSATVLSSLGLSKSKRERILEGWRKLRDRRHRSSSELVLESS